MESESDLNIMSFTIFYNLEKINSEGESVLSSLPRIGLIFEYQALL